MNLYIKQRVFSWGQKFDVYGEDGSILFSCRGEVFSFGRKLHVYDKNTGQEVIFIKQKLFAFFPRYEIYINGQHATTLVKDFHFFKHNFYYEGVNWKIEGDFFAHNYRITSGNQNVLTMSKRWFTWGDAYDLSLNERFNPLLALASAIVIDCVCHEDKNN